MEHLSPSSCLEKRVLSETDDVVRFAFGKNIVLNVTHDPANACQRDSSRANSQVLTDYKWENKANYAGRILAVRDKWVAYRLFNENTGEAIRVLERESRARHLIKDFHYPTVDLQWAVHAPFLAVLDINSNLYIYYVDEKCNTLSKYLNIIRDESLQNCLPKLTWCPYIPDNDSDQEKHLLAISRDNRVNIFSLHTIKTALNRVEVRYDQVLTVPGGVLTTEFAFDSEVMAVRLSPDATAMAVATMEGDLFFYVIDNDRLRFANRVRPLPNNYVEDILFLDNLSVHNQEQFWKYIAVSLDCGRRIAIFECDSWSCLAKLRFESPNQINRLEFTIDQTAHYIFVANYDSSSLYCIEFGYVSEQPCFTACTQIRFYNSLVCIAPCSLVENIECDLSLEDSEDAKNNSMTASFVAITTRSVMETSIDLERYQLDPNALIFGPGNQTSLSTSLATVIDNNNEAPILSTSGIGTCPVEAAKDLAALLNIHKPSNYSKKSILSSSDSNSNSKTSSEISVKFQEAIDEKLSLITERVEALQMEVKKLQQENRNYREERNEKMNAIEKISVEVKHQNERIEAILNESNVSARKHIVSAVETALEAGNLNLQSVLELSQTNTLETVRSVIGQLLVPAVEGVCSHLFQQLNETFRDGLQEFMEQVHAVQKESIASVTPLLMSDHTTLIQLIDTNQIPQAFDLALTRGDLSSLMLVCNKVDPDVFFSNPSLPPLSTYLLLSLLKQLAQNLDTDTDLKFRYIENVLICLNDSNGGIISETESHYNDFRPTLELLSQSLNLFVATDRNATYKRQTRIINQLIMNLLRSAI